MLPAPPSRWTRRRIGLLGGSFNPAHDGHVHISLAALRRLRLDEVWWLVAPQNPLKPRAGMAPFAERVAGARARVAGAGQARRIRVSRFEREAGVFHTVETLRALHRHYPRARFVWLMGADNLADIHRWRAWSSIFHITPIAILDRPSYSLRALTSVAARRFARARQQPRLAVGLAGMAPPAWMFLPIRRHAASATAIRAQGAADASRSVGNGSA